MRFVDIKTEQQQAATGIHKVRDLLMKQRIMLMNQLRSLMAEFGIVVTAGPARIAELVSILVDFGRAAHPFGVARWAAEAGRAVAQHRAEA